jgi:hypothetical protein
LPKLGEADFCTEGEKIVSAWNIEKERNKQKNPLSSPGGHDWAKKKTDNGYCFPNQACWCIRPQSSYESSQKNT